MPDQSSAADEHAILQEISAPLSTLPDDAVPIAADVDFPVVLRGYDRLAVDAYVKKTSQLVAELQATRSPEAAVRRALERVGEQISGILQRAHDTSTEITTQSRRDAENRLEDARREAGEITARAETRLKELDAETDRIWGERHRIVSDVRALSRQLVELAEAAATRFPPAEDATPTPPGTASRSVAEGQEALALGDDAEATAVLPPLAPARPPADEQPAADEGGGVFDGSALAESAAGEGPRKDAPRAEELPTDEHPVADEDEPDSR